MPKPKKTQRQLEALVIRRVRARPELSSVASVTVGRVNDSWHVASIVRHGPYLRLEDVDKLAEPLREKYDLA